MIMRLDVWAVRWTGGSFFMWLFALRTGLARDPDFKRRKAPALVLVTMGRKSGRRRAVVLPYFTFEGKSFVVGSKGGSPEDPDWVHNLRQNPAALVYINRQPRAVTTRIAGAAERPALWTQLVTTTPTYDAYQRGTRREIPLIIFS
jgi:deazaflavin-dependent oxidoreductase (nitroreductase family)